MQVSRAACMKRQTASAGEIILIPLPGRMVWLVNGAVSLLTAIIIGLQLRANRRYGQCCGSFSLAPLYQSCLNCWREEYRGVVDSYLPDIRAVRFPLCDYPCV